ncbi:CRE-EKL-1 protein [Caenorhabditis remanei]|uniref:CRE-EKL-1 protein n=1 Tax=Caenorhabditis remanei TaxID=31234 RepID=E3NJB2_CAERE|nr:CRE-EKL-1 protein [Caenorhabditis remanei]
MLSVGLRLTEEVFPGPEEPIADLDTEKKDASGSIVKKDPKMHLDGIDVKTGVAKIKRIVLNRTANVEFLRAESPSRIWVRLENHITDNTLTFREPFELKPQKTFKVNDYAIAPIDERVYRRCRIVEPENERKLIKIFFIDDATVAWVKKECLAEMDEHWMFYPWQAIQISMFGVYPAVSDDIEVCLWTKTRLKKSNSCFFRKIVKIMTKFNFLEGFIMKRKDTKVMPKFSFFQTKPVWTPKICFKLAQILANYHKLKLDVVLSTVVFNDYARPIPCKLYGIEPDIVETNRTVCIAQMLESAVLLEDGTLSAKEEEDETGDQNDMESSQEEIPTDPSPPEIVCLDMYDAAFHEIFEVAEKDLIPENPLEIHRNLPGDWKQTNDLEEEERMDKENELFSKDSMSPQMEPDEWNPRLNQIPMLSIDELGEKYRFPSEDGKQRIMLAVEGRCTKSPYEWYARPIVKTGKNARDENVPWSSESGLAEVDATDWMLYGNDELTGFAEKLDTYYSMQKNRKPLMRDEIKIIMNEKRDVFAVCAVNEEKGSFTGEWQRVLIVDCEEFAEVRFLDSGGRDMVLTSSLYRIHSQHCIFPPMCLRFAMYGVVTSSGRVDKKWAAKETSRFRMCLREDTPIFINIEDIAHLPSSNAERRLPHVAKFVLMVKNVSYMDESRTLLDRFLSKDEEGHARQADGEPAIWPPAKTQFY